MKNDPTKLTDEEREAVHKKYLAEQAEMEARLMRRIADVVDAWRYCDADDRRACRRAHRCAGRRNPYFVKHKEEFYSVIRKYILPGLKKMRGQGLYDPGLEVEVVDRGRAAEGQATPQRHPEVAATDLGSTRDRQFRERKSAKADLRGGPRRMTSAATLRGSRATRARTSG